MTSTIDRKIRYEALKEEKTREKFAEFQGAFAYLVELTLSDLLLEISHDLSDFIPCEVVNVGCCV